METQEQATSTSDVEVTEKKPSRAALFQALAKALDHHLSTGDVAEIRKLDPDDPSSPAFWKLVFAYLEPAGELRAEGPLRDLLEKRWAAVLSGMAITQGLHIPGRRVGQALAKVGFSELRFSRLLRAEGDLLLDLVRTTARFLASKNVAFDFKDLADLVFSDGAAHAETVRRNIARDYYRQLSSK